MHINKESTPSSDFLPESKSIVPGLPSATTKKQRQNAQKSAQKKELKQQQEAERIAKLNEYRKSRAGEQQRERARLSMAKGIRSENTPQAKVLSSGMRASVTESGSLIWE